MRMTRASTEKSRSQQVIERRDFQLLLDALMAKGYRLIGPRARDGALVYDEIAAVADLPVGLTDEQERGTYRLKAGDPERLFGCGLGPHSWKKYLYPPELRLWQAQRQNGNMTIVPEPHTPERLALIGMRACEIQALAVLDKVLLGGAYVDRAYQAQREQVLVVAVNCGRAGKTCFCASMNSGPRASTGFDLALTEVLERDRHYFVVESGSKVGADVLSAVPTSPALEADLQKANAIIEQTAGQMGRSLDTHRLQEMLYASTESTVWDEVAARCLTCGNCTLVCPTCFCTTVEDYTDLAGEAGSRVRRWDSCFTMDFSYIVGGHVRASARGRYRQWMMHKLATWKDQFGTAGCVGCGRCITWCPVGIDITEEAQTIRAQNEAKQDTGTRRKKTS
jgi:sulfhydrogenase subunit beta (sulfur reductase)